MLRYQSLKKLEKVTKQLTTGLIFHQETLQFKDRVANYYSCTLDKMIFDFEIFSSTKKHSLQEIVKNKFKERKQKGIAVGINTNAFLMADDGPTPKTWAYNLDISNGLVFQLPTNTRPTILTKNGDLNFNVVEASGEISLGGVTYTWRGSHNSNISSDFVAYGTFNIPQFRTEVKGKKFISSGYDSSWVVTNKQGKLLGFNMVDNKVKVTSISDERLNLFDFLFILKSEHNLSEKITLKNLSIDHFSIDSLGHIDGLSAQSLISRLPKDKEELTAIFSSHLIQNVKIGNHELENFRKAWSVILQTGDSIVFLIVDSRPKVKGQEGLNIFELHTLLSENFDFTDAFVSDAGQSSKICIYNGNKCDIYGNLHYLDYVSDPPVWRGKEGRFVPGALLAYNRFT
jgi:hypothetical protein